jgi:hypothetical protein
MKMSDDDLAAMFTYHPPGLSRKVSHERIRQAALAFARTVNKECPDSREKSLAITHIQTASMFANGALAIHGERKS